MKEPQENRHDGELSLHQLTPVQNLEMGNGGTPFQLVGLPYQPEYAVISVVPTHYSQPMSSNNARS